MIVNSVIPTNSVFQIYVTRAFGVEQPKGKPSRPIPKTEKMARMARMATKEMPRRRTA